MSTLVEITVFIVRFKDQLIVADPVSDMYAEASFRIDFGSEEYNYIQNNLNLFSGDKHLLDQYINVQLENGEDIILSGEAKDICFKIGQFESRLEYKKIPWSYQH